jgi:hypothetical protein
MPLKAYIVSNMAVPAVVAGIKGRPFSYLCPPGMPNDRCATWLRLLYSALKLLLRPKASPTGSVSESTKNGPTSRRAAGSAFDIGRPFRAFADHD